MRGSEGRWNAHVFVAMDVFESIVVEFAVLALREKGDEVGDGWSSERRLLGPLEVGVTVEGMQAVRGRCGISGREEKNGQTEGDGE